MCTRRYTAVLVLTLLTIAGFAPMANAAPLSGTERAHAPGLAVHFELWLINAIERVETVFGFKVQTLPAPGHDSNPPSAERDCGSGIDPNGASCTP